MAAHFVKKTNDIKYKLVKSLPAADVIALYKAANWWQDTPHNRKIIPKMVKNSLAFAIARDGRRTIGMGRVVSDGVSDGYIQDVTVLPGYRGRGVGQEIIRFLLAECAARKLDWVGLVAEPGTYAFYRKLGFKDKKGFQLMLYGS